jgi:hypothetical protein
MFKRQKIPMHKAQLGTDTMSAVTGIFFGAWNFGVWSFFAGYFKNLT